MTFPTNPFQPTTPTVRVNARRFGCIQIYTPTCANIHADCQLIRVLPKFLDESNSCKTKNTNNTLTTVEVVYSYISYCVHFFKNGLEFANSARGDPFKKNAFSFYIAVRAREIESRMTNRLKRPASGVSPRFLHNQPESDDGFLISLRAVCSIFLFRFYDQSPKRVSESA